MSNIEEDIKEIRESIEEAYRSYDYDLDYSPFSKGIAEILERILSERESDKKRIQELEKENKTLKNFASEIFNSEEIKDITQVMNKSFEEFMKDYIPKQKVKDEIEALRKMLKATMEGKLQEYTPGEIIIKRNTLEELLEESK